MTSKPEQKRLDLIHSMGCLACELFGVAGRQPLPTEAHHIVDNGYRKHSGGHMATLPLCGWHHRGVCTPDWMTSSMMEAKYGPSFALRKKQFIAQIGTERELLEIIDGRLSCEVLE